MADNLALARSFWAWIAKIEMNESQNQTILESLPKVYPTDPDALYLVTTKLCESLFGTKYYPRACYWYEIFESASLVMPLEETLRDKVTGILKALFIPKQTITPPKEINEGFVLRRLRAILRKIRDTYEQIDEGRRGFPTFDHLKELHTENDKLALAKTLDWYSPGSVSPEEMQDLPPDIRHRFKYAAACMRIALGDFAMGAVRALFSAGFATSTVYRSVLGAGSFTASAARETVGLRTNALAAFAATIIYLVTVAFGERSARDIFPN